MPEIRVRGFAKINLTLEVTGRRSDGYHLLRSVMQSVSLFDELLLSSNEGGVDLCCDDPLLCCGESNTIVRAARLFYSFVGMAPAVRIRLKKKIFYNAGLGSASADAAAVLFGLNGLYGTPLSTSQLMELGLAVGADVPFGLTGGTCLAEGIGERLTRLAPLPRCEILIAKPAIGVSTKEAFDEYDKTPKPTNPDSLLMAEALRRGSLERICSHMGNVLERSCKVLQVFELKALMIGAGALGAGMSGSGSSVFGIFDRKPKSGFREMLFQYIRDNGVSSAWVRPTAKAVEIVSSNP
jgi:4-diphosphocytidyl-2-C-methyl-D-erythritol kinase